SVILPNPKLYTYSLHDALPICNGVSEIAGVPVDQTADAFYAAIDSGDDKQIDAFLLAAAADTQHATSTCRMGAADDPRTVVTPDCRVLGFSGLRVIDASVFPDVPRANTHLAT